MDNIELVGQFHMHQLPRAFLPKYEVQFSQADLPFIDQKIGKNNGIGLRTADQVFENNLHLMP